MDSLILLDYAVLRIIWWILIGVFLIGLSVMDGFDLGIAIMLPFVARTDNDRRIMINVIAPIWEGNQVWLITAGGAVFAAWPLLYATFFSSFYIDMLLLLFALILRPVGFKYRSKIKNSLWRSTWDILLFFSGLVISLVFGITIGNIMLGMPFEFDPETFRLIYSGHFYQLFKPFAILMGLFNVTMLIMHGMAFLACRTNCILEKKARNVGRCSALISLVLFISCGIWIAELDGYVIINKIDPNMIINPLVKTIEMRKGAWLNNYEKWPILWILPSLYIIGTIFVFAFLSLKFRKLAFLSSAFAITGSISAIGISLFPFLMPSSIGNYSSSLTIWDSSSSLLTLWVMLLCTIILFPIVIAYTSWVYRVTRGTITHESVMQTPNSY